jgi:hypothetical protein
MSDTYVGPCDGCGLEIDRLVGLDTKQYCDDCEGSYCMKCGGTNITDDPDAPCVECQAASKEHIYDSMKEEGYGK